MTVRDHDEAQVRALLAVLDPGPVDSPTIEEVITGGQRLSRRRTITRALTGCLGGVAVVAGLLIWRGTLPGAGSTSGMSSTNPTFSLVTSGSATPTGSAPSAQPWRLQSTYLASANGFRMDPASEKAIPRMTAEQVLQLFRQGLDGGTLQQRGTRVIVRFGLVTGQAGGMGAGGQLTSYPVTDKPAWIVVVSGVQQVAYGPGPQATLGKGFLTEVIDDKTGQEIFGTYVNGTDPNIR